jgi:beta-carotene 3-hydroxylase
LGAEAGFNYLFFIGLGIFAYGLSYFMIHDVLIHQRFKWFKTQTTSTLLARKAHKVHHKNGKRG